MDNDVENVGPVKTREEVQAEEDHRHLSNIKLRVQLASENRLMLPLTYYRKDVTFLLNKLGIQLE